MGENDQEDEAQVLVQSIKPVADQGDAGGSSELGIMAARRGGGAGEGRELESRLGKHNEATWGVFGGSAVAGAERWRVVAVGLSGGDG